MNIPVNTAFTQTKIVSDTETALALGSGILQVYATPALITFIENTAMLCVARFLNDDYTSIGTFIECRHLKAVAPGSEIKCNVKLVSQQNIKLNFDAEVYCNELLIGKANHTRYIVDKQEFVSKVYSVIH
jgi:predicted thioesterase